MELYSHHASEPFILPLHMEVNPKRTQACAMLKLFFFETGKGWAQLGDVRWKVQAPAVLCLDAHEEAALEGTLRSWLVYFSPAMVNSAFNVINIKGDINPFPESVRLDHYLFNPFITREAEEPRVTGLNSLTAERMKASLASLKSQLDHNEDPYWPCRTRSFLIELLFLLQHCDPENEHTDAYDAGASRVPVADILQYLNLNYSRGITIEELCKRFSTNRNSLSRSFLKATGKTFTAYLTELRLNAAKRLLRETGLPVTEIAERTGFGDLSYWGRVFKRQTGVTPSCYRSEKRMGNPS